MITATTSVISAEMKKAMLASRRIIDELWKISNPTHPIRQANANPRKLMLATLILSNPVTSISVLSFNLEFWLLCGKREFSVERATGSK
jgi:hypothetical protein